MPAPFRLPRRARLYVALNLLSAALAHAQPPVAVDVPADSLDQALNQLARQTGVQILFASDIAAGKNAPALKGEFTVMEALQRLLSGTGLSVQARDERTFTVVPAGDNEAVLKTVKVVAATAAGVSPTPIKVDRASVTRSGASILDTPQTVNAVTSELTREQNAQTLSDVIRNIPGARAGTYASTYDWITTRGFGLSTTSGNLRNGFRFTNLVAIPQHSVERYELLKGPSSMNYGRVQPGGLLNIVTKQPQAEPVAQITVSAGQHDAHDIGFDFGGSLNDSQSVQYRLTGGTLQQAFPADEISPRQHDVGGALSWQLTEHTKLTVDGELSHRDQVMNPGLPVPDPMDARSADRLPVGAFYGEQSVGRFEGINRFLSVRIEQELGASWTLEAGVAHNLTRSLRHQVGLSGLSEDGTQVNRYAYQFDQDLWNDTAQAIVRGTVEGFGMQHRITVLADTSRFENNYTLGGDGTIAPIDLYSPQQSGVSLDPFSGRGTQRTRDYGVSVQDYARLTPWLNLLAGLRYSEYRQINDGQPDQKGDNVDPTVGLVFKPVEAVSLYASFAASSEPNAGTMTGPGQFADPSKARQYEVGGKAEWFDGALRTSLALYDLTRTNVPTASDNPLYSELRGEVRSRGWELDVVGEPMPGWNISASYGYTDSEVTEDNTPANIGKRLANTPRDTASLWTSYALGGRAQNWTIGGGVFYTGAKFTAANNLVAVPSNTIADLMASYRFDERLHHARVQINLRNVFDERYYESGNSNARGFTSIFPGLPRTLSVSVAVPLL